ncbi:MAG: hypothetical protein AB1Z31_23420 [Desulfobacterales bacterium]
MAIGTVIGAGLGVLQISLLPPVRLSSRILTQFFRNSPWLVLLFYCMFMLPFEITIRDLAEEGMTCLLVTHEMGFARELADHMYFTDNGVIVEHGPPRKFFEAPEDPRTKEFLSQIL